MSIESHPDARDIFVAPGGEVSAPILNGTYEARLTRVSDFGMKVVAYNHDDVAGALFVYRDEVCGVEVEPDHRRRGVATALFALANANSTVPIRHSSERTAMGDGWAQAVRRPGEVLPDRDTTDCGEYVITDGFCLADA